MQTYIIKSKYKTICKLTKDNFLLLNESGNLFILYSTEYDSSGNVKHDIFDIIKFCTSINYIYVNTIIYPKEKVFTKCFNDNVGYIIWFCKNSDLMIFDKDKIREKHIWKDVEWGKREKNYNPKGKDPGNVWIPTEDDGQAHITKHIVLSEKQIVNRLLKMSKSSNDYEFYNDIKNNKSKKVSGLKTTEIKAKKCKGTIVFKSSESMSAIKNNSIKSIITSPPYWNLKDYFKKGQIGQEDYKTYIKRMCKVWKECYKKLSSNGTLWININLRVNMGKLIPIPKDFIDSCIEIGFYYKGIFIWHKSSGIPTSSKNIGDHYEFVLIFTKCEKYIININQLLTFNDYKNSFINNGCIWNINKKAGSVGKKTIHPAIYPNELVDRLIKISTSVNDNILDPFLGSGTTVISALNLNRNCIGYEYNEGFKNLIQDRIKNELINDSRIKFITK